MNCPKCGSYQNSVIDSRLNEAKDEIRRERFCNDCGERFQTRERICSHPRKKKK